MHPIHRRHDISDRVWALLEPHLPGREGAWGGVAKDNRLFINAVSGFCERVRRGAICRPIWAGGATRTAVLSGGGILGLGKSCWKS